MKAKVIINVPTELTVEAEDLDQARFLALKSFNKANKTEYDPFVLEVREDNE